MSVEIRAERPPSASPRQYEDIWKELGVDRRPFSRQKMTAEVVQKSNYEAFEAPPLCDFPDKSNWEKTAG